MRCKKLTSITAFFVAFVFSAAFAGLFIDNSAPSVVYSHDHTYCFRQHYDAVTADAITDLLRQDVSNGADRFSQLTEIDENFMPPFGTDEMDEYADVVQQYADESGSLDDANLPRDVRQAWRKHMRAWRNYAGFLKDTKDLNYSSEQLRVKDLQYGSEISRTWANLLHISRTYGASIPE